MEEIVKDYVEHLVSLLKEKLISCDKLKIKYQIYITKNIYFKIYYQNIDDSLLIRKVVYEIFNNNINYDNDLVLKR